MDTPEKDYTRTAWLAVTALIAVLVAVSFIPPRTLGGIKLRRANILSDLIDFDDAEAAGAEAATPTTFDEEEFRIDLEQVAERIVADTTPPPVQISFEWDLRHEGDTLRRDRPPHRSAHRPPKRLTDTLTPIEDFDTTGLRGMRVFCDTLLRARRPVRIAFFGDSFVEGDILTADLREQLQILYGGGGPGFAPMASPLTGFRRTISTQSKGWNAYNIMQRKRAPENQRENFYVSGWVCQPSDGASTRWEQTDARQRLDSCRAAQVLFRSPRDSRIELIVNDTARRTFDIAGDAAVRRIVVRAPHLHALTFRVLSGAEDFTGYGALFEGDAGIVVDNYSIRSNNGQAMFWTNPSVNAQIDALVGYDLVILQYGLNIMQAGVLDYSGYARQIEKMVAYVRQCFPKAAVLILGVSDRSVKTDRGFEPMDAVPRMTEYQRRAARNAGAAFWPTSEAMRAQGGMERFVQNGWAGKDFTHINYEGGRRIARALVDALNDFTARHASQRKAEELRIELGKGILTPQQRRRIERRLLAKPRLETLKEPRR